MKKGILSLSLLLMSILSLAQTQGNHILIINSDSVRIDLNEPVQYKTETGEQLTLELVQPQILTYSDNMISFKHDKSLVVSNSVLEEGMEQCMIMKSTGNGFMVQKYNNFNPSGLTRLMLDEIIKESINYGYTKTEKKYSRKIKSGQTIEGIQATLIYKGQKEVYTVATYGGKDEGILVLSMLLNDDFIEDQDFIELFLNTLAIKI